MLEAGFEAVFEAGVPRLGFRDLCLGGRDDYLCGMPQPSACHGQRAPIDLADLLG